MGAGVFVAPGCEELSFFIVDDDVVLCFVGEQEDAALGILYHFVAVFYRIAVEVELAPLVVESIAFVVLTEDRVVFHF